jgi:hypothetical protein
VSLRHGRIRGVNLHLPTSGECRAGDRDRTGMASLKARAVFKVLTYSIADLRSGSAAHCWCPLVGCVVVAAVISSADVITTRFEC